MNPLKRRRVLQGMCRVDVEKTAAVGAQLLDDHLRSRRTNRNMLFRNGLSIGIRRRLDQRHRLIRPERLHHALRHEHQCPDDRQRQKDVEHASGQVVPEVADRLCRTPDESANQSDQYGHSRGRRHEVLHGQPEHLRQIAQRRLAAVALPVRIRGEADGRVHRQIGRHGGHAAADSAASRCCIRCRA